MTTRCRVAKPFGAAAGAAPDLFPEPPGDRRGRPGTRPGAGEGGHHRPDPAGGGFRPGDRGCRSGGRGEKLVFRRAPGQAGAAGTAVKPVKY